MKEFKLMKNLGSEGIKSWPLIKYIAKTKTSRLKTKRIFLKFVFNQSHPLFLLYPSWKQKLTLQDCVGLTFSYKILQESCGNYFLKCFERLLSFFKKIIKLAQKSKKKISKNLKQLSPRKKTFWKC